jgi:serine phosphatase RsbU (regulator of sigma subunit)
LIVEVNKHFIQTIGKELQAHTSTMAVEMEISVCMVNRKERTVKFASTHSPLYHLKGNENAPELEVYKSGGKAVANRRFTPNIPVVELKVEKGDRLIFATDGKFDQLSEVDKKRFGQKQFFKLLLGIAKDNMEAIHEMLEQSYKDWQGIAQQIDDITKIG